MKNNYSKLIAIGFAYNVMQSLLLLFQHDASLNWLLVLSMSIPIIFVSFCAMKLDKVSYILLLYWFFILSFGIETTDISINWKFGYKFQIVLIDQMLSIDPTPLILFVITLFEIDSVFPEDKKHSNKIVTAEKEDTELKDETA